MKREQEKKTVPWDVSDPKLPVIQSCEKEGRICNNGENDGNDMKLSG